ncbi:MFS transporter [archaeon]|nr:MFS transporter [archaeon]
MSKLKIAILSVFFGMMGWNMAEKFLSIYLNGAPIYFDEWSISMLIAVIYSAFAVSSIFSGMVVQKYGSKKCMSVGLLAYSSLAFSLGFAPQLPNLFLLLILCSILVGIGGSLFWTGFWTFVLKNSKERGKTTGMMQGVSLFGSSIAVLIGGLLYFYVWHGNFENIFLLGGGLLLLSAIFSLFLKENKSNKLVSWKDQKECFKDKRLLSLGLVQLFCSTFTGLTLSILPIVIKNLPRIIQSPQGEVLEVAIITFVLYSLGIFTAIFTGKLSDKKGRKPIFYSILLAGFFSSLFIALSTQVWMILIGILIYGPFLWLVINMVVASVGDLYQDNQSLALVVTGFLGTLGVALGALIGAFASMQSLQLPFFIVGLLYLICIPIVRKLPIK